MYYRKPYDPVFDIELHLIWDCRLAEFRAVVERISGGDAKASITSNSGKGGRMVRVSLRPDNPDDDEPHEDLFFLWLPKLDWEPTDIAFLTHELLHMVEDVCELMGIPICPETEEFRAYYLTYWVKMCLTALQNEDEEKAEALVTNE